MIAYHQPITRAEIEEIRGVGLGKGTLDNLLAAGPAIDELRAAGLLDLTPSILGEDAETTKMTE
ncbi:MAG: SMC-Scp complex subunit ScpB [Stellaceae bacterium]